MDKCSTQVRTEGEGKVVEEEVDSAKADKIKNKPKNTTSTTSKISQTCEVERFKEGGAIMQDQADKTI